MEYARGAIENKAGYKAADASGSVTSLIPAARLCACVCVCVCVRAHACLCVSVAIPRLFGSANSLISTVR